MGETTKKHFLIVAGVISTVLGLAFLFPAFLQEIYWLAGLTTILVIGGIILLAIGFGD